MLPMHAASCCCSLQARAVLVHKVSSSELLHGRSTSGPPAVYFPSRGVVTVFPALLNYAATPVQNSLDMLWEQSQFCNAYFVMIAFMRGYSTGVSSTQRIMSRLPLRVPCLLELFCSLSQYFVFVSISSES